MQLKKKLKESRDASEKEARDASEKEATDTRENRDREDKQI